MPYLLDGLSLGCIYAFIALGYTMVYGIIKLINFAHGEVFMVGAFLAMLSLQNLGVERAPLPQPLPVLLAWLTALSIAAIGAAVLAVVIDRVAYKPLRARADRITALVAALGMSLFLQNVMVRVFSAGQQAFPEPRMYTRLTDLTPGFAPDEDAYVVGVKKVDGGRGRDGRVVVARAHKEIGDAGIAKVKTLGKDGVYQNITLSPEVPKYLIYAALAVATVLLQLLVKYSRHGKAMRAVSHSEQTARLMGVNVNLTISFTFAIGAALAGAGGLLWGLRYGKVEPYMGALPGLKAFTAAVLGGIGSIPGAVLGGVLLGVLEALCQGYLPDALVGYKDAAAFLALIAILLVRPQGLLGRFEGEKV